MTFERLTDVQEACTAAVVEPRTIRRSTQQPDQQCGAAVVEVDGPQHIRIDRRHIADQLGKKGLGISAPARQQPLTIGIGHHPVVA
ncbi:hypothetical protein ACPESV_17215 [Streptomyces umbrinus]|uniref:hypothetical protein n=1 Tax=Streptomyces umbrinus TaxID=67370 RepID=UPI003C2E2F90